MQQSNPDLVDQLREQMGGPRGPPGAPDPDNKKEGDN